MSNTRILAVDDSKSTLEVLKRNLQPEGYEVYTCERVEEALPLLEELEIDLVITDYRMPKTSGLELIKHIRANYPEIEIMMITGYPSIPGAVEAIKDGAGEYLAKPFTTEELLSAVGRIMERRQRRRVLSSPDTPPDNFGIIGESPAMQKVFSRIGKAAGTDANVLISGDSGTGKELVARAVHYNSDRRGAPFVPVNCTAIPDSLVESELFGHVKGAFTGAKEGRAGFFEIAHGGSIFLDEIGDASPNMQAKLLRVIQSKEYCKVGSSRVNTVDCRILAATHKDLKGMVDEGSFREDLYYRMNVVDIPVPSLAERGDDILALINHFLTKFSRAMHRTPPTLNDDTLKTLRNHAWPGNVRELENLIQRLVVIVDHDPIVPTDLPETMRFSLAKEGSVNRSLAEVEFEHISNVLTMTQDNKTRAAEILGINRKTLREKLKRMERFIQEKG
ncbi:Transcriptional regulatory protein ZraR [Pseudodesulfovibrio profundus]|uniref:Transcriptional regulatory protein ZraR n=1 Tax=Pseudodesulfovibrio profundus TaxID=57320 RepID=A0A2C8FE73_9BACT|nr:sigma-54 dependent transcriptional regulator [Pseudodesulfovibrio profundus]MBC16908.1 sigma-54-dependent Fis family transcriptional regulator [Desulfovibrio sp.]SOB60358.1 Transcriptional regulatory protein ZraR [Pseudodesulfovibrio profundus]|tara:strand:- start:3015 stop:4358 length:1344 start_codon:yes stop_codon:yes gene_type:complete